jgi:tRNA(Arg) A34 adenosine deaminase TadA
VATLKVRIAARSDADFMHEALALARKAEEEAEVPVGAVLVMAGQIVASGWNRPVATHDPTAHAPERFSMHASRASFSVPGIRRRAPAGVCSICRAILA